MTKRKILLVGVTLISWLQLTVAQDAGLDSIKNRFMRYTVNNLTEKVYVHTDRNFYIPGEFIWFKAYVVNAVSTAVSNFSKVVYVDVLDENNRPQLQAKIYIDNGTGNGSLYIPVTLGTGAYKIRGYTNWMKNYDPSFYFEKKIQVVNTFMAAGLPIADSTEKIDIHFFPEGGNLVAGIETKMAYKITASNGNGMDNVAGFILNQKNDTIQQFKPYKFGIGSFLFKPGLNQQYKAVIKTPAGKTYEQLLPVTNDAGYTMQVNQSDHRLFIEVNATLSPGTTPIVYLLAHTRNSLKVTAVQSLQNGKTVFVIPEEALGEGITHLTIFNSSRQAVAERLFFKKPADKLQIQAITTSPSYNRRKKIDIEINTSSNTRPALAAGMSLAIYREDGLQKEEPANISSYLWLSSDLKGRVEQPNWYFTNSDSARTGLDNLMLTHGWRRFYWSDLQNTVAPSFTFLPEIDGHIINGRIFDSTSQKPFVETPVYLSIPGLYTQFYGSASNQQGLFKFFTRNVLGPGEISLQAEGLEKRSYNIEVQSPFSDKYTEQKISSDVISEAMRPALEKASLNAQVQRKYAWEYMKKFQLPDIDTSTFYGKPDERYKLDDYTRFTTMEEVLREYVLGVLVGRSGGKFKLTMLDVPNNRLFRDNPLVLLDGVPVLDMDRIMTYDPLKVSRIELVKRRYYYGQLLFDGIVNIITYKGDLESYQVDPKTIILDYDGLQLHREFYSPVYETAEQVDNHIADYRNLLFWSPAVNTDDSGKTRVSLYSSDLPGKYKVQLEGITSNGSTGSYSFSFEVK